MITKTVCSLNRAELSKGKPLTVEIKDSDGNVVFRERMDVRTFSTKSVGYNANGKGEVCLGEHYVKVQIGLNVTVIGSKELPETVEEKPALTVAAA